MTLFNSGQTGWAPTRILAPRPRFGEIVEAAASMVDRLIVGDPFDPATQIGPTATEKHRARVERCIPQGKPREGPISRPGEDAPGGAPFGGKRTAGADGSSALKGWLPTSASSRSSCNQREHG